MEYQVHQLLKNGQKMLEDKCLPLVDARLLLEYTLNMDFTTLLANYNEFVNNELVSSFYEKLRQRIEGIPLQYITHGQYFMGHNFFVSPSVLIPRPETELLVDLCMRKIDDFVKSGKQVIRVLDMCTGSGCIIISLAEATTRKYPNIKFEWVGVDLYMDALEVSKYNEKQILDHAVIEWIQSDLFAQIKSDHLFEIIVSNPPYIPHNELQGLMKEVKDYEPVTALDGGDNGLDFYHKISEDGYERLIDKGVLLFEIGHGQMQDIKKILLCKGYSNINEINDMADLERIISGSKN